MRIGVEIARSIRELPHSDDKSRKDYSGGSENRIKKNSIWLKVEATLYYVWLIVYLVLYYPGRFISKDL